MSSDDHLLAKEVSSGKGFEYALHQRNARLFNKILSECIDNEEYAVVTVSSQSLFIALIYQQQKMISTLTRQIRSNRNDAPIDNHHLIPYFFELYGL
jgi:hypothetical protein